jgi:hypothetical protein
MRWIDPYYSNSARLDMPSHSEIHSNWLSPNHHGFMGGLFFSRQTLVFISPIEIYLSWSMKDHKRMRVRD